MDEKLENVMESVVNFQNVNDIWNNPVVKVLYQSVQRLPVIGEIVGESIGALLEEHQQKKVSKLFEVILKDDLVTLDMVNRVDVIMEFAKTLEVVNRLVSNEKVKYLGNLFRNTMTLENIDFDEYEEFLAKINDLSCRELDLLFYLYEAQENNIKKFNDKNSEERNFDPKMVWGDFLKNFKKENDMSDGTITAIISGTMRSGFVAYIPMETPIGIQGFFTTTPYFEKFVKKII